VEHKKTPPDAHHVAIFLHGLSVFQFTSLPKQSRRMEPVCVRLGSARGSHIIDVPLECEWRREPQNTADFGANSQYSISISPLVV
jgi:hypothetical protein